MYNRSFFPHTLRMSVSYYEARINVPTFCRFRKLVRLRQPHEASNRPPCRPSPGEVEAGGHGNGRSILKGSPRVEKRAAKRGERSDFHSEDSTILHFTMEERFFWGGYLHTFSGARGSFFALSGTAHAEGPPVHDGASLGPGWAPWCVLWALKVAKFGT